MEKFNLPKYSKIIYSLNSETKYFHQQEIKRLETPLKRLPEQIRLAPAGSIKVKVNAAKVLLSKECNNGKYQFITGLQPTNYEGWFVGNDYEYYKGVKVLSMMLFNFNGNGEILEVYYFHKYDKANSFYRMEFAHSIIPTLKAVA